MARPRKTAPAAPVEDTPLTGLEDLGQDPAPVVTRSRSRAVKAAAPKRGPGRPTREATRAQQVDKVRAELRMYLELMATGWEMRDPDCAAAATPDRLDTIADRLVAMIARSDSLLAMAGKTGIVGDITALLAATLPIASAVWRAHGPGGTGHDRKDEDYGAYPPLAR
jgi:hypothetical protein